MCVDLASELKLFLSTLNTILKNHAALCRRNHCDTHCWRIWGLIFLQGCYQSTSLHYYVYFVTSIPSPHFCCFQFKMYDDAWCGYSAVMVSSVRSYHDKTVRKLFPVCICTMLYLRYKTVQNLHFKWLAKVLCYMATHFFREHNFHFPDFTPFLLVPTKM
jgi:hypothetical protein